MAGLASLNLAKEHLRVVSILLIIIVIYGLYKEWAQMDPYMSCMELMGASWEQGGFDHEAYNSKN